MTPEPSLNGPPLRPKYVCKCPGECEESDYCFVCNSRVIVLDPNPEQARPDTDDGQEMIS